MIMQKYVLKSYPTFFGFFSSLKKHTIRNARTNWILNLARETKYMGNDLLTKYLQDIDKEGQISQREEVELVRDFRKGNFSALHSLVKANLRFVIYIAKQYQYLGLSLSDLISEGNIGLIKAAERFNETKGNKFITYAVYWIRESIMQGIYENARLVRYPKSKIVSDKKIKESLEKSEQLNDIESSQSTVLFSSDLYTPLEVHAANEENQIIHSDSLFSTSDIDPLVNELLDTDSFSPDRYILADSVRDELKRALKKLTHLESNVIERYYGLNGFPSQTLEEIGKEYKMTRERIRQIKESGLKKLKQNRFKAILEQLLEESA